LHNDDVYKALLGMSDLLPRSAGVHDHRADATNATRRPPKVTGDQVKRITARLYVHRHAGAGAVGRQPGTKAIFDALNIIL
jgi:hypothetical protein